LINSQKIKKSLKNISQDKLNKLWLQIDTYMQKLDEKNSDDWKKIMYLKEVIKHLKDESNFHEKFDVFTHKNIEKENIKVKLSYPHEDYIAISDGIKNIEIIKDGNKLIDFSTKKSEKFYYIKGQREYLEIKSWERKPRLITKSIRSKKETGKSIIIFFILKNTIILEYFYSYDMKMIINAKILLLFVMGKTDLPQKIHTHNKEVEN
jgi:hypothetical protein